MHSAETSGDKAGTRYELEADRLYEQVLSRWGFQNNVWRTAWAMDTILDYRRLRGDDKARLQAQMALEALNPQGQGNWWDDFGWIGIAALRAVQQDAIPNDRDRFLRIAINAWAYMFGPGWSTPNEAPLYPFADRDLPGWCEFCAHRDNIGAPNVWKRIGSTFPGVTEDQKYKQQPRHSPGGAWNSPITQKDQPVPSLDYVGENAYLNPVQNTVTNALYALLTLRVLQASDHPDFKPVFDEAKLDLRACRQAWIDQARWLDRWCTPAPLSGPNSISLSVRPNPAAPAILLRERVSTYVDSRNAKEKIVYWDSSYDANRIWIGDQGLMLGVLREGQALPTPAPKFTRPENIIAGVFEHGFAKRLYGGVSGVFPLPWINLAAIGDAIYDAHAPGNDKYDYQTGVAVFMRYLLQAHESAGGQLPENYARMVRDCADRLLRPEFDPSGAQPAGVCDAFVAYRVEKQPPLPEDVNLAELTPLVNRLSVLLMAIALERSS